MIVVIENDNSNSNAFSYVEKETIVLSDGTDIVYDVLGEWYRTVDPYRSRETLLKFLIEEKGFKQVGFESIPI